VIGIGMRAAQAGGLERLCIVSKACALFQISGEMHDQQHALLLAEIIAGHYPGDIDYRLPHNVVYQWLVREAIDEGELVGDKYDLGNEQHRSPFIFHYSLTRAAITCIILP
jgi:hypothetical protein